MGIPDIAYKILVEKKFQHSEELQRKEIRLKEVMSLLEKDNEKQKETVNPFPWVNISSMSYEEVQAAVQVFTDSAVLIENVTRELTIESISELREKISDDF